MNISFYNGWYYLVGSGGGVFGIYRSRDWQRGWKLYGTQPYQTPGQNGVPGSPHNGTENPQLIQISGQHWCLVMNGYGESSGNPILIGHNYTFPDGAWTDLVALNPQGTLTGTPTTTTFANSGAVLTAGQQITFSLGTTTTALRGITATVSSVAGGTVTLTAPLSQVPVAGDTFGVGPFANDTQWTQAYGNQGPTQASWTSSTQLGIYGRRGARAATASSPFNPAATWRRSGARPPCRCLRASAASRLRAA